MFAHLTERGIELEPTNHTERYAVNAYMKANPDTKVFVLGDLSVPAQEKSQTKTAPEKDLTERAILMSELDAAGIAYDKKAGTRTLRALLTGAAKNVTKEEVNEAVKELSKEELDLKTKAVEKEVNPPVVAPKEADIFADPAPVEEKKIKLPSKDEFREIVKQYAFETSTEKAMKLLKELGNYTSVSQIPEEKYSAALNMMGKTYGK